MLWLRQYCGIQPNQGQWRPYVARQVSASGLLRERFVKMLAPTLNRGDDRSG